MNRNLLCVGALALVGCLERIDLLERDPEPQRSPPVPVLSIDFDEGGGSVVSDSARGISGTLTGGSWISDGAAGSALHLEPGDYVSLPNISDPPADFTVALWVRFDSVDVDTKRGTILSTELLDQGGWELHGNADGAVPDLDFGFRKPATVTVYPRYFTLDCCQMSPLSWHHIAVVLNATTKALTFYEDAKPVASRAVETFIQPGDATLYIGAWAETFDPTRKDPRWFKGSIDELRIYDVALVEAELIELARRP